MIHGQMVIPVIKVHIFHFASDARVDKLFERRVCLKKMGEFGGQNAHSTLNTDCESGV